MRLAVFIAHNHSQILKAWDELARTQTPVAQDLDDVALEDHGKKIVEELALNSSEAKPLRLFNYRARERPA